MNGDLFDDNEENTTFELFVAGFVLLCVILYIIFVETD
jgi:hypothetical protein